jgi:TRAP-type C4-dicarboxylate transport system permease small subunit
MTHAITTAGIGLLQRISRTFALLGGLIMLMLAIITVSSILGRTFLGQSVEGDYELTEMGLAMAIFLFLPECYLRRGHIIVDIFTANCRPATLRLLDRLSDILFTLIALIFAYRMSLSGLEAMAYLDQSMILELPTWWIYAVGVVSMSLCSLCGLMRCLQIDTASTSGVEHE